MKELLRILLSGLLLAGAALSCQREETGGEPRGGAMRGIIFTSGTEFSVLSKVNLGSGLKPCWQDSDSLAVFDGSGRNLFIVSDNFGSSATFGGNVAEGATQFDAIYPYVAARSASAGVIAAELPSVQTVAPSDSVCPAALLCAARTDASARHFSFRNAFSLIKVDIGLAGVTSVVLKGKNGEKLAGPGTIDVAGDCAFIPGTSAATEVTLLPSGTSFTKGKSYYIAVAPVEFTGGFEVIMQRTDGADAVKASDKPLVVRRNEGVNLADVATTTTWSRIIMTKAQLFDWVAGYAAWSEYDIVKLGADIDMEGEAWPPHAQKGVFDGQGYKLYNFRPMPANANTGLFSDVTGTVKNLIIGSSDGSRWDGVSVVSHSHNLTSWCNVGAVAGRIFAGGSVENIINFAAVEVAADDAGKTRAGGIVGFAAGEGAAIRNCKNYGTVSNLAPTAVGGNGPLGGIIAAAEAACTIDSCANYGTITNNNARVNWVGGIMGVTNGRAAVDQTEDIDYIVAISNCLNEGDINVSAGGDLSVGGITGYLTGADISGCTNTGTITSTASVELKAGGIAGKFYKSNPCTLTDCINRGTIKFNQGGSAAGYIGGIIGNCATTATADLTLTRCSNYADLAVSSASVGAIGGIAGWLRAESFTLNISDCHNYGSVRNTSTDGTGTNLVAGFVAYLTGTEGQCFFENCTNEAEVYSDKPSGSAGYAGGFIGNGANCNASLTDCVNSGKITLEGAGTGSSNAGGIIATGTGSISLTRCSNSGIVSAVNCGKYAYVGGLVGNATGVAADACVNGGAVFSTSAAQDSYAGGLFGNASGSSASNCVNSGRVSANNAQAQVKVGGLAGQAVSGSVFRGEEGVSTNTGEVIAEACSKGHANVGGIAGYMESGSAVYGCINDAPVSINLTASSSKLQSVAGIVGRFKGASGNPSIIDGCTNKGPVRCQAVCTNQLTNGGGITGDINTWCTVTNNVNAATGTVSVVNNVAASGTVKTAYAGGIFGGDNEGSLSANGNSEVRGNVNYARVSATVTNGAAYSGTLAGGIGAGGIGGIIWRSGTFEDNSNYGDVSAYSGGATMPGATASTLGGPGAVLGFYAHTGDIVLTAKVSKGISVGSISYEGAETVGRLASWLCPTNSRIEATYVDPE